jgi:hypothetical protein
MEAQRHDRRTTEEPTMKEQTLAAWIDSHGTAEPTIDNGDGTLTVACSCVNVHTNASFIERSTIPGTLSAARDWLGY